MAKRRRPFVAVETDVAKDESFAVLGDVCGYNRDEALGRIIRLWAWCADRKLQDAPEGCPGYAVSEGVVVRFLGPAGVRGILGDGVSEFALGERWGDLIYLRGTDATVAARRSKIEGAVAGGEARAREILATAARGEGGQFVSTPTIDQPTHHPSPAESPPSTSVDPRSQIPDPADQNLSLTRPIPQSVPQPAPTPVPAASLPAPVRADIAEAEAIAGDRFEASKSSCAPATPSTWTDQQAIARRDLKPENAPVETTLRTSPPPAPILPATVARAEARRRLIGDAWQLGGDAFRELGREGIEPGAFDPWAGMPGAGDEGMKLLIAHVDRLLIGDPPDVERARAVFQRRIAVAKAEGRVASPPTRRWLTPMRLWNAESFAKGAEMSPEQVRPRTPAAATGQRAGPQSAPPRPRDRDPPPTPIPRDQLAGPEQFAEARALLAAVTSNDDETPDPDEKPRRKAAK